MSRCSFSQGELRILVSMIVSCCLFFSNHTLLSMPMPFHDAAQSLKPQTEQNLRKVSTKNDKGPEWQIKKDHGTANRSDEYTLNGFDL